MARKVQKKGISARVRGKNITEEYYRTFSNNKSV